MKKYLIIFFLIGIIFRLWFINLQPQPFAFDQEEYHHVALDLMGKHEYNYASAYRVWGYPLVLSAVYSIFGSDDTFWWKVVQAVFDAGTAVFVFLTAKELFKNKIPAFIGFLLYLFNPFTSAYVGVRLTEITAIMLVTVIFYLLLKFIKTKESLYLFFLAIFLGFLPFVRPGYLFFSLFTIVFLIKKAFSFMRNTKSKIVLVTVMSFVFLSFFIFNMARNYIYFKQVAPLTVDNLFVREFYISLYIGSYDNITDIPPEVTGIYQEYSTAGNAAQRNNMAKKYLDLALAQVKKDPVKFAAGRIEKLWFVWEKHNLFTYENPKNVFLPRLVYWGNIVLFVFSASGLAFWIRRKKEVWAAWFFLFLTVYISVLHAFTITADRFSLPAYPLIFLFAGYGVYKLICSLDTEFR